VLIYVIDLQTLALDACPVSEMMPSHIFTTCAIVSCTNTPTVTMVSADFQSDLFLFSICICIHIINHQQQNMHTHKGKQPFLHQLLIITLPSPPPKQQRQWPAAPNHGPAIPNQFIPTGFIYCIPLPRQSFQDATEIRNDTK